VVRPSPESRGPRSADAEPGDGLRAGVVLSELERRLEMLSSFEGVGREEASALRGRRDRLQADKDDEVRLTEELGAAGQTIMAALERGEGSASDASGLVSVRVTGALDRVEVSVSERASHLRDARVLVDAVASAYAAAVGQLQQGIVEEVERVSQGRPLLMAWVRSARSRLAERAGALGSSRTDPLEEEAEEELVATARPAEVFDGALGGQVAWREPGGPPERIPGLSALG
jgi:DNA-binding protein YbaB